jgi:hypothetical protein
MRQLIYPIIFFACILLYGCNSGACITGSGTESSQVRQVDEFNSIKVGGSVRLIVKQGTGHQVRVTADDNLQ